MYRVFHVNPNKLQSIVPWVKKRKKSSKVRSENRSFSKVQRKIRFCFV